MKSSIYNFFSYIYIYTDAVFISNIKRFRDTRGDERIIIGNFKVIVLSNIVMCLSLNMYVVNFSLTSLER